MKKVIVILCLLVGSLGAQTNTSLAWAKAFGDSIYSNSSAVDVSGNVIITGWFRGTTDFDPGPGLVSMTATGIANSFVCKLNANGNLVWVKTMPSTGSLSVNSAGNIVVDQAGNIYVQGSYYGTNDFDPGPGSFTMTSPVYDSGGFLVKLDASGNFIWAKSVYFYAQMHIDLSSNIYLSGDFTDTIDVDPGPATYNLIAKGLINKDGYLVKLDASGNFLWGRRFGTYSADAINVLKTDLMNNVYATGFFQDTVDFDPGPATVSLISAGDGDIFLLKLDPSGNFVWVKQFGGTGLDVGHRLTLDPSNNIYMSGMFNGLVDFDPGQNTVPLNSSTGEFYLMKLDQAGNFSWAKSLEYLPLGMAYNAVNNMLYTSGAIIDTCDMDPGPLSMTFAPNGPGQDNFLSIFDVSGNFSCAGQLSKTIAYWIHADPAGSVYMSGWFAGTTDFDTGTGVYTLSAALPAPTSYPTAVVLKMNAVFTGIEASSKPAVIQLWPNPTDSFVTVSAGAKTEAEVIVFNNLGQKVHQSPLINPVINLSHLENGVYTLLLRSKGETLAARKIIKK